MRFVVPAAMCALALPMLPAQSGAQRVSGTVRDEAGAPVRAAIVSAFSGKDTAAVTLTRTDGGFQLALPRKDLTLLVRAIGLQPVRISLRAGIDSVVSVRMTRIVFRLAAVSVREFTSCAKTQTGTANIYDVWQEVTTALENTRLVRDSKQRVFDYIMYQRMTDAETGKVRVLRNDSSSWRSTRPFKVTPPKELASRGYVVEDFKGMRGSEPSLLYRAPDEMVLLDETFQTTHCFWASHGDGANQGMIGVYFMPVSGIKINDIRGVFWIDSTSYELKRLDYIYTQIVPPPPPQRNAGAASTATIDSAADTVQARGVEPGLRNPEPGGILLFARLPDGTFIIPDWCIYLNDTWPRRAVPGEPLKQPRMLHETGGTVVKVSGG